MRISSLRGILLFVLVLLAMSSASFGQLRVSVSFGPPALPVYEQPLCPGDGYIWTPGYWAWDDDAGDYYWVPGTWILAPEVGYLWTPPYWAWVGRWLPLFMMATGVRISGFYGGIDYGFDTSAQASKAAAGENGLLLLQSGRSEREHHQHPQRIQHYVVNNNVNTVNRVSFNGGNGGVNARPTPEQEAAMHERHLPPAGPQVQHAQAARGNPELRASANHGKPPVAATARAGELSGREAVPAREAGSAL